MNKGLYGIALFTLIILSMFSNVYAQGWTKIEGTNDNINRIFVPTSSPNTIVVASDIIPTDPVSENLDYPNFGFGFQISTDKGETFGETKLEGFTVLDIVQSPLVPDKWYASISQLQRGGILVSTDNGETWNPDNILCDASYQIYRLASKTEDDKEYIFGAAVNTGNGFVKSEDGFETCSTVEQLDVQSRDVEIHKSIPGYVFLAGDNFYEGGVFRSSDDGTTWEKSDEGIEGLRVLCVLASTRHPERVYCGCDSVDRDRKSHGKGIYMSLDTGKTFKLLGAPGARVYDISEHPSRPEFLAAACGEAGVFASANGGGGWEVFNEGLPADFNVTTVTIPDWDFTVDGGFILAGVFGQGLYQSGRVITTVEDEKQILNKKLSIKSVYPQPFKNRATIVFSCSDNRNVKIIIRDHLGRVVHSFDDYYLNGDNVFTWSPAHNLAAGAYYLSIESGALKQMCRLLKVD